MAQYRKKPVVIEAVRFPGRWIDPTKYPHEYAFLMRPDVRKQLITPEDATDNFIIATLEGEMTVRPGDYVILGVKGELYPCKADIFEATYESLDAE